MTITTEQAPAETHVVDVRVGPQPAAPKPPRRTAPSARTVNARPVAAFIGNAAMIGGASLYAATGPVGLIAAGATVAATGAAGAVAKGASNRRESGSVWRSSSPKGGWGLGLPKPGGGRPAAGGAGRSAAGPKGRGLGSLVPGGSGAAAKKRAATSGSATPGASRRASAGASGGPGLGARFRKLFGAGAGKNGSAGGRSGSQSGASRAGRAARILGRGLASPFRAVGNARHGLANGATGRQAAAAARQKAKQAAAARGAKRAGWLRGWGSGLFALAAGGTRSAWRRIAGHKKTTGQQPNQTKASPSGVRKVATAVRRPGTQGNAGGTQVPVPAPVPAPQQGPTSPANNPVRTVNAGGVAMSRQLFDLSEQMVAAAARHEADGMLEVADDFAMLPYIMANVAKANHLIVTKASERYPVHPAVIQALEMIHRASLAVVQAAEQVSPAFERLHAEELNRLRNPRRGEEKWDVRANRRTA